MAELKEQFNPTEFDVYEWAQMAKNMDVKYATLTTKHHDGFCLFLAEIVCTSLGLCYLCVFKKKDNINGKSGRNYTLSTG